MGTYERECSKCGDSTVTHGWEPDSCPFCADAALRAQVEQLESRATRAEADLEIMTRARDHEQDMRRQRQAERDELRERLSVYLGQQAKLNNEIAKAMVKMEDRIEALESEVARLKRS